VSSMDSASADMTAADMASPSPQSDAITTTASGSTRHSGQNKAATQPATTSLTANTYPPARTLHRRRRRCGAAAPTTE